MNETDRPRQLLVPGLAESAVSVGELAPDFVLPTPDGRLISLDELLARGPAVIGIYRSARSPYGRAAVHALHQVRSRAEALGASLTACIVADEPFRDPGERQPTPALQLVRDRDGRVARLFGLLIDLPISLDGLWRRYCVDLATTDEAVGCALLMPATYVIDREGIAAWALIDPDYSQVPDGAGILAALRRLAGRR